MAKHDSYDSGDLIAAVIVTVIGVSLVIFFISGGRMASESDHWSDEKAINELRAQRI